MAESILDATNYILMALDNIKTIEELQDYKEEIKKAIFDIRDITQNLININKITSNNLNSQESYINSLGTPSSNISSRLGLKFNYDAYLNDLHPKNELNQEVTSDILNNNKENDDQNKIQVNSHINEIKTMKINNNNQKGLGLIPSNDEKNKFISPATIDNSGNHNKKLREKYNIGNNKIGNKRSKMNGKKGKERINLLADIVMKINSEDYFYDILTEIYGDDLTDKLMSNDVSDDLLNAVQKSINDIEQFKNRESNKNENGRFSIGNNLKSKFKNKNLKINTNNSFNDYNFINLRKYNSQVYNVKSFKNGRKKSNNSKKEKPFISTTCPYGNYFDPPLQKGGMSKLNFFKK